MAGISRNEMKMPIITLMYLFKYIA